MKLSELEKRRLIKKHPIDTKKTDDAIALANRDISTAIDLLQTKDFDWAYNIAYNAMLQSARALMFSKGYRPGGEAQHVSVIRFCETVLGADFENDNIMFDRMRRKRHTLVYDVAGSMSQTEAHNAVMRAKEFVEKIKKMV